MDFNNSQRLAIHHGSGPMLVLAGPGSGKTTVIINRIRHLTEDLAVPPSSVLAVTFSKKAAREMSVRFRALTGGESERRPGPSPSGGESERQFGPFPAHGDKQTARGPAAPGSSPAPAGCVTFGTFHSVFLKILKSSPATGPVRIITESEKYSFMRGEIELRRLSCESANQTASELLLAVSRLKNAGDGAISGAAGLLNGGRFPEDFPLPCAGEIFRDIFSDYQEFMNSSNLIDFDDIILMCLKTLSEDVSLLRRWQSRFRFIMVDEFQDINPAQYKVIRLLAGDEANLFVVGDDDQSIYGFRGAHGRSLKTFLEDYPGARQVLLGDNYRCPENIINSALKVIDAGKDRLRKSITAVKRGGTVRISSFESRRREYFSIAEAVRSCPADRTVALLFRNNEDCLPAARMLEEAGIRSACGAALPDFSSHFTCLDILSYLKAASYLAGNSPLPCRAHLLRILNRPVRYISRAALQGESACAAALFSSMERRYSENGRMIRVVQTLEADLLFISSLSPYAAVKYIRRAMGYDKWLSEFASERGTDPFRFFRPLDEFEEFAAPKNSLPELEEALQKRRQLALAGREEPRPLGSGFGGEDLLGSGSGSGSGRAGPGISYSGTGRADPGISYSGTGREGSGIPYSGDALPASELPGQRLVHIMTMHASKGTEFDIVFIPDANEGVIPGKRAEDGGSVEEERRLFYVAMTRAAMELHISYVNFLHNKRARPSRFLKGLL